EQGGSEFGTGRYALLFMPGSYPVDVPVGYFTQVVGLGASPDRVEIAGHLKAGPVKGDRALVTFWRSAEGLSVRPPSGVMQWAVSQAAPLRRMHVRGDLVLHQNSGYASGGWMSDTAVDGLVNAGSQQQSIARNCEWEGWKGANWNMVFVGTLNAPRGEWPGAAITRIDKTPLVREKPFLMIDTRERWVVRVPGLRADSSGVSWQMGLTPGRYIPLGRFHIARPGADTAATINAQLARGRHVIFTPGTYRLRETIRVTKPDTVVMGLGFATLLAEGGVPAMSTADVDGIVVSGLVFDAGADKVPVLLDVGPPKSRARHAANPASLHDVFFRVGGAARGRASVCLRVNAHDTIVDHAWIWRADHGAGVGWTGNVSANGIVVNGSHVTVYGLFVEHHQEFQTLWNGEAGRVYFYQSEVPHDPPDQASYSSSPGTNGWAAYKVADGVTRHEAWGLGVYSVFSRPGIALTRAFEVPSAPGVMLRHLVTACIGPNGEISNVVNDEGGATLPNAERMPRVTAYPAPGR
ncbi:MAG TPA: coagulation factor 5/8 type domain-containing protein, partial [Vicinamibacterales bacterium]|nr:coagulation factor 5/8 type domain-containing protein [Vicinamibacterales bacterium]